MELKDTFSERIFRIAVSETDAHELDGPALEAEPRNFVRHVAALSASKIADGLVDPKLVLSWLLGTLGAPATMIGLLVPIREAGALLPQTLTAPRIRAMAQRKWAWAGGSLGQGIAALAIAGGAMALDGWAAGALVLVALTVLALARSVCSVSYKDVLGRTIDQGRRGTATGMAATAASVGVLVFAGLLMTGLVDRMVLVLGAIGLAGILWLTAAAIFSGMDEQKDPGTPTGGGLAAIRDEVGLLRDDANLRWFVAARGLLVPTALAPPYVVLLATAEGAQVFEALGALVLASALASLLSSYIWGRLADRSSRLVLILSGAAGAAIMVGAVILQAAGLMATVWAAPLVIFVLMVAYRGVRLARSTYLVDFAPKDRRAEYTAIANTAIGIILLVIGVVGSGAAVLGAPAALLVFAAVTVAGSLAATRLRAV